MRLILSIVILLLSQNSFALLKIGKHTVATTILSGGVGTIQIKVPGTFTTLDKNNPLWSGRDLKLLRMFFSNPATGDLVKSIVVKDIDGKVPVPLRPMFPNYPIINDSSDEFQTENKGLFIPPGQIVEWKPEVALIPSEFYVEVEVKKASAVIDNFYINVMWDDRK